MFILLVLSNQLIVQFFSNPICKILAKFFCFPELFIIQERLLCTEVSSNGVFKFGNRQPEEKARST